MKSVLVPLLCLLLGGCVIYPRTAQPGITFQVQDATGRPVQEALVTLASFSGGFVRRDTGWSEAKTDERGVARIPHRTEVALFIAAPDGVSGPLDWAWCVEKKGYRPSIRNYLKAGGVKKTEAVTLQPGSSPWEATWSSRAQRFTAE